MVKEILALLAETSEAPLAYSSYVARFIGTLRTSYNYGNPLQMLAASVYVLSQSFGLEPLWKDLSRWIERDKRAIPSLTGRLPRVRENTFGFSHDLKKRRFLSAFFKLWNYIGDVAADGLDLMSGVRHTRTRMQSVLAEPALRPTRFQQIKQVAGAVRSQLGHIAQAGKRRVFLRFLRVPVDTTRHESMASSH